MKLNDKDFYILWGEALSAMDRDAFISDIVLSSMWEDEPGSEIPQERIEYVARLWDAAHMSIKDICQAAELTQTAFAIRFCIPLSTVWDWCRGARTPTNYFRLAVIEALGIFQR